MFSKLGSVTLGKLRGIGYKLGLVKFKIEDVDLSKIPEIKIPKEYENWHVGQEKERPDIDDISIRNRGKVAQYSNRGNQ
jgi:hypothetical protein